MKCLHTTTVIMSMKEGRQTKRIQNTQFHLLKVQKYTEVIGGKEVKTVVAFGRGC